MKKYDVVQVNDILLTFKLPDRHTAWKNAALFTGSPATSQDTHARS